MSGWTWCEAKLRAGDPVYVAGAMMGVAPRLRTPRWTCSPRRLHTLGLLWLPWGHHLITDIEVWPCQCPTLFEDYKEWKMALWATGTPYCHYCTPFCPPWLGCAHSIPVISALALLSLFVAFSHVVLELCVLLYCTILCFKSKIEGKHKTEVKIESQR